MGHPPNQHRWIDLAHFHSRVLSRRSTLPSLSRNNRIGWFLKWLLVGRYETMSGEPVVMQNGKLHIPNNPIIHYIEGDGIGIDKPSHDFRCRCGCLKILQR